MNILDLLYLPTFRKPSFQSSESMRETSHARLNAFQSFVIAGSSASLARATVNGYSVLKICAQVGVPGYKQGPIQAGIWTWRLEGFGGFFKGLNVAVVRSFPQVGIQFTVFDQLAKQFVPDVPAKKPPTILSSAAIYFCGGTAGSVATMFTHPLDLVKTRLVVQGIGDPLNYAGVQDCFAKILKSDGVAGLYRGLIPSLIGSFVFSGQMFMWWDLFQRLPWMRRDAPFVPFEWFIWPCAAVAVAASASHPFDVWRRKMMAFDAGLPRKGRVDIRADRLLRTFIDIYKANGVPGYLYGYVMNMSKVVPQLAVFWLTYKTLQKAMLPKKK